MSNCGFDNVGTNGSRLRQAGQYRNDDIGHVNFEVSTKSFTSILRPMPSVPSAVNNRPGTKRAICSGTIFIKSVTATIGSVDPPSNEVTRATLSGWLGCKRLSRSTANASSRSALYDVDYHNSTPTLKRVLSSSTAAIAAPCAEPLKRTVAVCLMVLSVGAACHLYKPDTMCASVTPAGRAGMT